jgi:hypothetical protein
MPYATLTFEAPLNVSCQVGDTAYYVSTTSGTVADGGFTNQTGDIVEIGSIRQIDNASSSAPVMLVDTILGYDELNGLTNKFILFNKNNKANMSSPVGYYASVKMANNSTDAAELFSVGMDSFESSK